MQLLRIDIVDVTFRIDCTLASPRRISSAFVYTDNVSKVLSDTPILEHLLSKCKGKGGLPRYSHCDFWVHQNASACPIG